MYTILLNESKALTVTRKEAIVQFSNLCDKIQFLIPPVIGENDMSEFDTVLLVYRSPMTKMPRSEFLTRSEGTYKGCLQYLLPVDTKITVESGDIELRLTLYKLSTDNNGDSERQVFETLPCCVTISPVPNWSKNIPNQILTALDDRIFELLALQKEITEMQEQIMNIIDDDTVATNKTYSSDKIEGSFIDNDELNEALGEHSDIVYSDEPPKETNSHSWFKIES